MQGVKNKILDWKKTKKIRPFFSKKGTVLAYVLVIMTVVLIILTSVLSYVSSQIKFAQSRVEREKAFQVAESGIYYYRWYLAHATDGMSAQQLKAFWQNASTKGVSGDFGENYLDSQTGEVIGAYQIHLDPPDSYSTIATVTSTGWTNKMPGLKRIVKARFRRPSWSEHMWLIDGFVSFGSGANVYGKVHSNFGVRFDGVAHNSVTSLNPSFDDPSHLGSTLEFGVHTHSGTVDPAAPAYPWPDGTVPIRSDVFQGGRQFPVPKIEFNSVSTDITNMRTESQSGSGRYFDGTSSGRRIILKTDGTFDVCTVRSYNTTTFNIAAFNGYLRNSGVGSCSACSDACLSNYAIPNNGIIFVEDNVWVEGTISDKRVTIVSTSNAFLGNSNLLYSGASFDGSEIIGIVAQNNVAIIANCPNNTVIDGALLAQSGKVYRQSSAIGYSDKNSLTINGAIASFLQPYFNQGSNGFTTRTYNFDNNLLYYPPPYFPTGTEYSIDLWEEL